MLIRRLRSRTERARYHRPRRRARRGLHPQPPVSARRQSRHGQDHNRNAVPADRRGGGRTWPVHQPVGDPGGASRDRPLARVGLARRPHDLRADPTREPARWRAAAEPALLFGPRTRRDHPAIFDQVEAIKPSLVVLDSLSAIRLLAAARCATAGRSWRSSTTSPGRARPC